MTINSIIELSAAKDLYQDCWLTELPRNYVKPTESEKKWLWNLVKKHDFYQKLTDLEQQALHKQTEKIESTVPMISSTGKVLNVNHRLYLSYLIAKGFVYQEVVPLNIISSIVIYPTYKLRKVYDESGLVICKGINYLLNPVHCCYNLLDLLKNIFSDSYITYQLLKTSIEYSDIKKTTNNWVEDVKYIESIIEKKQFHFKDKIEATITKLIQKIETFQLDVLVTISKENKALIAVVELINTNCQKELIIHLSDLLSYLPMLEEPNKVSIHISWHGILQNMQNNDDVVVHEMAHVIDFFNGGLNGVPVNTRKFNEVWKEAYQQEKEKQSFLNPCAFKNKVEFFAVCSEVFFNTPDLLKQNIPAIFNSLAMVYGYVPHANKKTTALEHLKLSLFSKIATFKMN